MSGKPESGLADYENPSHDFADNLPTLTARFSEYPDGLSWKSSKVTRIATIASDDSTSKASGFAGLASVGFVSEARLPNGYVRRLADGSTVTLRLTPSRDGSPAVDLSISTERYVRKIHFVRRGHE